jgi:AhpD family alkylhydroperoxidase
MISNFERAADEVNQSAAELTVAIPDAMRGFKGLGSAAYADATLSKKTKELMALAISISVHCGDCVSYHARRVAELGASREEVQETVAVAIQMGGGPSMVYGGQALRAFDSFRLP